MFFYSQGGGSLVNSAIAGAYFEIFGKGSSPRMRNNNKIHIGSLEKLKG